MHFPRGFSLFRWVNRSELIKSCVSSMCTIIHSTVDSEVLGAKVFCECECVVVYIRFNLVV